MEKNKRKVSDYFDCIVIGGGAAGMMAAITAANNGVKTAVIEHTKRLGSKLLQTGNGKCNLTNFKLDMDMYQNDNKDYVMSVINTFDNYAVMEFFESIGVYCKDRNGYVYPNSDTAASLQDAMRLETEHNCRVYTECVVTSIQDNSDSDIGKTGYIIEAKISATDGKENISVKYVTFTCMTIIIATGSKAAPKTGSDGSGYVIARKLGHRIMKPLPALVQLVSDNKICKSMSGVRSTGIVKIVVDGEVVAQDKGEIQYADYGISGIPVFQVSRYAVRAIDENKKVSAVINMLPDNNVEDIRHSLLERVNNQSYKNVEQFFSGLLNKKLIYAICKKVGIDINDNIKDAYVDRILNSMCEFKLDITGYKGFENAQICQGGVLLDEISCCTMMSKKAKGIFFAGELMDVDGKCGGYNLQWAWSSGHLAGESAADWCTHNDKN